MRCPPGELASRCASCVAWLGRVGVLWASCVAWLGRVGVLWGVLCRPGWLGGARPVLAAAWRVGLQCPPCAARAGRVGWLGSAHPLLPHLAGIASCCSPGSGFVARFARPLSMAADPLGRLSVRRSCFRRSRRDTDLSGGTPPRSSSYRSGAPRPLRGDGHPEARLAARRSLGAAAFTLRAHAPAAFCMHSLLNRCTFRQFGFSGHFFRVWCVTPRWCQVGQRLGAARSTVKPCPGVRPHLW
jgi:hypothetical protein